MSPSGRPKRQRPRKPRAALVGAPLYRNDQPRVGDAWGGIEREPLPDSTGTAEEWMWSRSLPLDGINEIRDASARAILDTYKWQTFPRFDLGEDINCALKILKPRRNKTRGLASGRVRGEAHHSAKITNEVAASIKSRLAGGERVADIARAEQVSYGLVFDIKRGRSWAHVSRAA